MKVEPPALEETGTIAGLWVDLASDQRAYGSHLAAAENRDRIEDSIGRAIVNDNLLVARTDGEIAGFVMFSMERRLYVLSVARGTIHNLYVAPQRRGRGIGSRLLTEAEATLAAEGADRISLETLVDNDDAKRFYETRGYRSHRIEFEKRIGTDNPPQ